MSDIEKNTDETNPFLIKAKDAFVIACEDVQALKIIDDFGKAFVAVGIVNKLREALSDEVMEQVFMPLMNTKVGFLTDRPQIKNGNIVKQAYSIAVVRDALIEGIMMGLTPTENRINILAERAYPTKEGYTYLLKNLGVKYLLDVSFDKGSNPTFAEIPVKISYEYNGEKKSFPITATVKKDSYASHDALRGKAERRAKKALYEYITGSDFGEAGDGGIIDIPHETIDEKKNNLKSNQAPTLL